MRVVERLTAEQILPEESRQVCILDGSPTNEAESRQLTSNGTVATKLMLIPNRRAGP